MVWQCDKYPRQTFLLSHKSLSSKLNGPNDLPLPWRSHTLTMMLDSMIQHNVSVSDMLFISLVANWDAIWKWKRKFPLRFSNTIYSYCYRNRQWHRYTWRLMFFGQVTRTTLVNILYIKQPASSCSSNEHVSYQLHLVVWIPCDLLRNSHKKSLGGFFPSSVANPAITTASLCTKISSSIAKGSMLWLLCRITNIARQHHLFVSYAPNIRCTIGARYDTHWVSKDYICNCFFITLFIRPLFLVLLKKTMFPYLIDDRSQLSLCIKIEYHPTTYNKSKVIMIYLAPADFNGINDH